MLPNINEKNVEKITNLVGNCKIPTHLGKIIHGNNFVTIMENNNPILHQIHAKRTLRRKWWQTTPVAVGKVGQR